mmetsp:Transcript_29260/g.60989  ORF Transcript_29260/g.60989 Transcript_29260/m.60989 type:complete len:100 (-) Transcript_29260:1406-1705(-)
MGGMHPKTRRSQQPSCNLMSTDTCSACLKNAREKQSKYQRKALPYASRVFGNEPNQNAANGIGYNGNKSLGCPIGEEGTRAQDSSPARAQAKRGEEEDY